MVERVPTPFAEPARVEAGALITVIAPSSTVTREQLKPGAQRFGARYKLRIPELVYGKRWFLAGGDEERLQAVRNALADESAAIFSARGGSGAARLLPRLSTEEVRTAGKLLIGFSDTTALHALWARAGLQ